MHVFSAGTHAATPASEKRTRMKRIMVLRPPASCPSFPAARAARGPLPQLRRIHNPPPRPSRRGPAPAAAHRGAAGSVPVATVGGPRRPSALTWSAFPSRAWRKSCVAATAVRSSRSPRVSGSRQGGATATPWRRAGPAGERPKARRNRAAARVSSAAPAAVPGGGQGPGDDGACAALRRPPRVRRGPQLARRSAPGSATGVGFLQPERGPQAQRRERAERGRLQDACGAAGAAVNSRS